ncbi:MAG: hypothetical protein LBQ16_02180 [Gracilibacteraceae bacterium]|jgi:hypothetical protein|nr:hypothetical protein [Gracilibacteraceae bacterium]
MEIQGQIEQSVAERDVFQNGKGVAQKQAFQLAAFNQKVVFRELIDVDEADFSGRAFANDENSGGKTVEYFVIYAVFTQ